MTAGIWIFVGVVLLIVLILGEYVKPKLPPPPRPWRRPRPTRAEYFDAERRRVDEEMAKYAYGPIIKFSKERSARERKAIRLWLKQYLPKDVCHGRRD
jgi:hypothetical protein